MIEKKIKGEIFRFSHRMGGPVIELPPGFGEVVPTEVVEVTPMVAKVDKKPSWKAAAATNLHPADEEKEVAPHDKD